jgi:GNAT superfamily N-acetyltransferase
MPNPVTYDKDKSLYANYIGEIYGKGIVESERGFATYSFLKDGIYIEDIYVTPSYRHEDEASRMADQVAVIAKEKGCKCLYGSVNMSIKDPTTSLKVLLAYGFKVESSSNLLILLRKEI